MGRKGLRSHITRVKELGKLRNSQGSSKMYFDRMYSEFVAVIGLLLPPYLNPLEDFLYITEWEWHSANNE